MLYDTVTHESGAAFQFLNEPPNPGYLWLALDRDRQSPPSPPRDHDRVRPSDWPAGRELLMRDIVLLRLLELEERRDESGATRQALAGYFRIARPRISAIARGLEADELVKSEPKRPGGHGRVRKVSALSEIGRRQAAATRRWVLGETVELNGVAAKVESHLRHAGPAVALTSLLRGAKFLPDRTGKESRQAGEDQ